MKILVKTKGLFCRLFNYSLLHNLFNRDLSSMELPFVGFFFFACPCFFFFLIIKSWSSVKEK